jgi:hypothetical protein
MHTLKKPFTLLLILSHLNAFVLGGVSNVHAANQVVDATKSPTTYIEASFILILKNPLGEVKYCF